MVPKLSKGYPKVVYGSLKVVPRLTPGFPKLCQSVPKMSSVDIADVAEIASMHLGSRFNVVLRTGVI